MKYIVWVFASIFLFSCRPNKEKKEFPLLEKANWFLGEWKNKSEIGDFTEKWEKLSDSTFMGQSFIIKGKDTIFHENVVLEQKQDSLFYEVSLSDKNQENITSFYLTSSTNKQLVFENPKHDFPTKIVYNFINTDSIVASIHGKQKGKETSETFPMARKK